MIKGIAQLLLLASVKASWTTETIGTMTVHSNSGGATTWTKTVIMLHGGGGDSTDMRYLYDNNLLGDTTNIRYVFPDSTHSGYVWYESTKDSACGLNDACAYTTSTITTSADNLAAVVADEKTKAGWSDSSNIYVAGYSQGG